MACWQICVIFLCSKEIRPRPFFANTIQHLLNDIAMGVATMATVYPRQILLLLLIFTTLILSLVESFFVMSYRSSTSKQTKISSTTGDVDDVLIDDAMIQTYDKLATRLINRYQKDLSSNKLLNNQLFVCVAGGPGSGKSTCEYDML